MNERQVQLALYHWLLNGHCCAMPNFTPGGWWECDVWAVTKAGYAVEFEIKVSVNDFKNDAKKSGLHRVGDQWVIAAKHEQMGTHPDCPSRFYYVVPDQLVGRVSIPQWAGLIAVGPTNHLRVIVEAPKLHNRKAPARQIVQARKVAWHRYWKALTVIEYQRSKGLATPGEGAA